VPHARDENTKNGPGLTGRRRIRRDGSEEHVLFEEPA
jgi:hypothetical protein